MVESPSGSTLPRVELVEATSGAAPDVSALATNSPPDDVAFADVGGGSALDVITLEGGALGIYLDVAFANGDMATASPAFGDRSDLAGYDTLAVGNFFGDAQLEIYAINSANPAAGLQCFHVDGMEVVSCDSD